jgi:hypothetical protein
MQLQVPVQDRYHDVAIQKLPRAMPINIEAEVETKPLAISSDDKLPAILFGRKGPRPRLTGRN